MDLRTHSASVSSQLRRLLNISKSSRRFEPALDRFLGNAELESFVDNLRDGGLEEFIDFLDEVRRSTHRSSYCCNRSIRYYR